MSSRPLRAAFIALASLAIIVAASPSLSLRVTGLALVHDVDNMRVKTILANTGDETLNVLNDPRGPLSKMPTDTFTVTDAKGTRPSFRGIKVKYVPSTAAGRGDYTVLAPGESIEVEHNLAEAYNFSVPGEGSYTITAKNTFYLVDILGNIAPIQADVGSGTHITQLSGRLHTPPPLTTISKRDTGCTSDQQLQIGAAAKSAESYATSALSYLQNHTTSTKRFTTWFGSYDSARHATVVSHFTLMSDGGYDSFIYDCTCTNSNTYAYVYADIYGIIYLCGAFWNAPNTGTDSKAGTLIHESSHFTENGGTDDYVYGQDAAKSLAISNPSEAIMNADSHEYFAENSPALP